MTIDDFYANVYALMDALEHEGMDYEEMFDRLWEMEADIIDDENDISRHRKVKAWKTITNVKNVV